MNVFAVVRRGVRRFWAPLTAAALAVACGGGTSQVDPFQPQRLIVLGDENSVIVDDGRANGKKYSVNGLDSNQQRDCALLPIWVQSVANQYGFVFAECNASGATPKAFLRAKVGAKVDDPTTGIVAQVAEQTAAGGAMGTGDLVSVMFGANDLHELAVRLSAGTLSYDQAISEARQRGTNLAAAINSILAADTRALVSTVPDIATTPFGRLLDRLQPGIGAQLTQLSYEFNARLRTTIDATRFDGRNYALVLSDDLMAAMTSSPGSYGLTNVSDGVCRVELPECTSAPSDLVTGASVSAYMWADERRMAPTSHAQIGGQAVTRATRNPF